MRYFVIAAALVVANFINQATSDELWSVAVERSFFQASAVFIVWCCSFILDEPRNG